MISIMYSQSCLSTAALIFYTCVWIPFHHLKMSLFNLLHYCFLNFPGRCPCPTDDQAPLPVARYQDVITTTKEELGCPICLQVELESEELVSQLPKCGHVFHLKCIEKWVERGHFTCPLCRAFLFSSDIPCTSMIISHTKYYYYYYCGGGGGGGGGGANYFTTSPHSLDYSFLSF